MGNRILVSGRGGGIYNLYWTEKTSFSIGADKTSRIKIQW